MDQKYDRETGLRQFDEVYAKTLGELPPAGASQFVDYMLETLFGTLWADQTLSIRDRRLLLLGVAAAQGDDSILAIQLRAALLRGELSPEQLEPLTVFLTQYVGYPRGSLLFRAINEVKQAQGKEQK